MSSEKYYGISCDTCDDIGDILKDSKFTTIRVSLRLKGWRTRYKDKKHLDICPECLAKEAPNDL